MSTRTYSAAGNGTPISAPALLMKEFLDRAGPQVCLDIACNMRKVPKQSGQTVIVRRAINPAVNLTPTPEGVNPVSRALTTIDYNVSLTRYKEVFEESKYNYDLDPSNTVKEAGDVLSDLVVRTREAVRFAALKAGTNVLYNTSSISTRVTVNGPCTLGRLQVAVRNIRASKGAAFTKMSTSSTNYGSQGCEPAYFVFVHSDAETDIRSFPGFVAANTLNGLDKAAKNAQLFGATQNMLFFTSPELTPFTDAGASITGTGLKSTTGTSADVYPWIVMAKNAATSFMLMGDGPGGLGAFEPIVLDKPEKSDPTNERIMIGGAWYDACLITAQEWMYRVETGVTANP